MFILGGGGGGVEEEQIRNCLWNNMESKVSCNLLFLPTAKLEKAQELYYNVNDLRHIYDCHQNYFSLAFNDLSLEDYYAIFKGICEELILYQPISAEIKTMQKQRDYMHVAHSLLLASNLSPSEGTSISWQNPWST